MSKPMLVSTDHDGARAALRDGRRVFITPIANTLNHPEHVQVDYISDKVLSVVLKTGVVVDSLLRYYVEVIV